MLILCTCSSVCYIMVDKEYKRLSTRLRCERLWVRVPPAASQEGIISSVSGYPSSGKSFKLGIWLGTRLLVATTIRSARGHVHTFSIHSAMGLRTYVLL